MNIGDPGQNFPKYCDIFKHFLVEELVLESDYRQLHYGKCTVVGRLSVEAGLFVLQNVALPNLEAEYSLPGGVVGVQLLNINCDTSKGEPISHGAYYIVRGETELCNVGAGGNELLTVRGLHEKLLHLNDEDIRKAYLETVQQTYKPIIKVWNIKRIENADALIESKLEIRMLCSDNSDINAVLDADWSPNWHHVRDTAWQYFWQIEGHELLQLKWHKKYPEYLTIIDSVTNEEKSDWQSLWEKHACQVGDQFWHIFSCAFENYQSLLGSSLNRKASIKSLQDLAANLISLDLHDQVENKEKNSQSKSNEDLTSLEITEFEAKELQALGLPTSFGTQTHSSQKETLISYNTNSSDLSDIETDSDVESELIMSESTNKALHSVQSGYISKRQRHKKFNSMPKYMEEPLMYKYWLKRFSLFSRFDQGIRLDRESWFSVTPEKVAKHTAHRLACDIIVDGFCGCGGNAIQFAQTCALVIAVDIDAKKLKMAKHNAKIYGVAHKIEFIHADFFQFALHTKIRPDIVFLSPPWGGPSYLKQSTYDLEKCLQPRGATQLMEHARRLTNNVGVFLPRNANMRQILQLAGLGNQCEVEHNYLDTRLVAITAYYGQRLIKNNNSTSETNVDKN